MPQPTMPGLLRTAGAAAFAVRSRPACVTVKSPRVKPGPPDGAATRGLAKPASAEAVLPVFLTVVRSAKGGMLGMCSTDTWMVRDPELILRLRAMLRGRARLDAAAVSPYAPSPASRTRTITPFSTSSVP